MSHGKNALRAIKQTQKAKNTKEGTEKELKSEQTILSILECFLVTVKGYFYCYFLRWFPWLSMSFSSSVAGLPLYTSHRLITLYRAHTAEQYTVFSGLFGVSPKISVIEYCTIIITTLLTYYNTLHRHVSHLT